MKHRHRIVIGIVTAFALLFVSAAERAWARNYHVSGGIQYVVQGDKEKAKRNFEDAIRIYGKAVAQLTEGLEEDPKDIEAWDYLGRAYAELDSAEKAGWAFARGIEAAEKRGDEEKLVARMKDNRRHYWAKYFQAAIESYSAGQSLGDEAAADSARTAIEWMSKAIAMNAEEAGGYCNLAVFHVVAGDPQTAMQVVDTGLEYAPRDSCLLERKGGLMVTLGEQAKSEGQLPEAIRTYEQLLEQDPDDPEKAQRLAQFYFEQGVELAKQADEASEAASKNELREKALDSYTKAAQNFGLYHDHAPEDVDARYNFALALVRAERNSEAAAVIHEGLMDQPSSPDLHSLLASAYRGLDLEDVANGHSLMSIALREGETEADPSAFAEESAAKWGARTEAAKLLKELGAPSEVRTQTRAGVAIETWFWWDQKRAVTLHKGRTVTDLDFSKLATTAGFGG